ncbi:MAG: helix-turn-helix domain-containing protein [Armatimonadota bacterium]
MTGRDIQRARETAKVNQQTLADALGLTHRTTIADIENESVEITDAYALRVIGVIAGLVEINRAD